MANVILGWLASQVSLGVYLKLHIHERSWWRPRLVLLHRVLGVLFPTLGWIQALFGAITIGRFCGPEALGQCLAHYIMGSAFAAYGVLLVLAMGTTWRAWLAKTGRSQESLDSAVILVWGIVNTFTEHHGGPWTHKDLQHTALGVLWWAGGALGVVLSSRGRQSIVPALVVGLTGWAMSAHEQVVMLSSRVHAVFGWALMGGAAARIVEICFLPPPSDAPDAAWRHLVPYGLIAGGLLFMSATDEEIRAADTLGIDHVTYSIGALSAAFLLHALAVSLIRVYSTSGVNTPGTKPVENGYAPVPIANGHSLEGGEEVFELGEAEEDADDVEPKLGAV